MINFKTLIYTFILVVVVIYMCPTLEVTLCIFIDRKSKPLQLSTKPL